MTGVEILAIEEVVVDYNLNWLALGGAFGITFGIFVIIGVIMSFAFSDWDNVRIGIVVGLMFGALFGGVFGIGEKIPVEYETQYKVIISDEVSMSKFADKYKIIEQEGKIYTVIDNK